MNKINAGSPAKTAPGVQSAESGYAPVARKVAALKAQFSNTMEKPYGASIAGKADNIKKFKSTESLLPSSIAPREIEVEKPLDNSAISASSSALAANVRALGRGGAYLPLNAPRSGDASSATQLAKAATTKDSGDATAGVDTGVPDRYSALGEFSVPPSSIDNDLAKSKLNARPGKRRIPTRVTVGDPLEIDATTLSHPLTQSPPQAQAQPQSRPAMPTASLDNSSQNLPRPTTALNNVAKPSVSFPAAGFKLPSNAVALPRVALRPSTSNTAATVDPVRSQPQSQSQPLAPKLTPVKPSDEQPSKATPAVARNEPSKVTTMVSGYDSSKPASNRNLVQSKAGESPSAKQSTFDMVARVRVGVGASKTPEPHAHQPDATVATTAPANKAAPTANSASVPANTATSNRIATVFVPSGAQTQQPSQTQPHRTYVNVTEKENEVTAKRSIQKASVSLDLDAVDSKKPASATRSDVISSLADQLMSPGPVSGPVPASAATSNVTSTSVGQTVEKRVPPAVSTKPFVFNKPTPVTVLSQQTTTNAPSQRVGVTAIGKQSGYADESRNVENATKGEGAVPKSRPVPATKPTVVPKSLVPGNLYANLSVPVSVTLSTPVTTNTVAASDADAPVGVRKRASVAEMVRNLQKTSTQL